VKICESSSTIGEHLEVGRVDFTAEWRQIRPTEVIGDNNKNIWWPIKLRIRRAISVSQNVSLESIKEENRFDKEKNLIIGCLFYFDCNEELFRVDRNLENSSSAL